MENLQEKVNIKLDEIIELFNSSQEIKRLEELKNKIKEDKEIEESRKSLLEIENQYSKEYIEKRVRFFSSPLVEEYKSLENELMFLTMEINQKLGNLLPEKKGCK